MIGDFITSLVAEFRSDPGLPAHLLAISSAAQNPGRHSVISHQSALGDGQSTRAHFRQLRSQEDGRTARQTPEIVITCGGEDIR